jgi:hypothetical protein
MSKNDKVIWARIAKNDLAGIIEYIAPESPSNARKILKENIKGNKRERSKSLSFTRTRPYYHGITGTWHHAVS